MHVVFSLQTGGLENGVVNLCNRLPLDEYLPTICVFRGGGALEGRLQRDRVTWCEVRRFGNHDPTLPFRLAWELRRRQIDIVHTHSWGTLVEGVLAAKLAGTPVMVHGEHGLLEERPRNLPIQRWLWSRTQQVTSVATPLADRMANASAFHEVAFKLFRMAWIPIVFARDTIERHVASCWDCRAKACGLAWLLAS